MKTLPTLTEIRGILIKEIASAIGESEASVSLQISEFTKENETYVITGTFTVVPFIFITRSGRILANVAQTEAGLRVVKLKVTGDKE